MTIKQARSIARNFYADYIVPNRQWAVCTLEGYLPAGHYLIDVQDDDFFPVTIDHLTRVIVRHCKKA